MILSGISLRKAYIIYSKYFKVNGRKSRHFFGFLVVNQGIMKDNCKICHGEQWVCEDHPDKAWGEGDGCCGAAGMLCVCTVTGYFERMRDLFKKTYNNLKYPFLAVTPHDPNKLGIPERQEPLGYEFEKVLHDNLWELYEE